jgi:hypothetical protein
MTTDIETVERKVEELRSEVGRQLGGVREELKELTKALRDLIRLDGDMKRTNDALIRIGKQVDGHETRLHTMETIRLPAIELAGATGQAVLKTEAKHHNWMLTLLIGGAASIFTGLVVFILTH